jgi:phosphatidylglycerophosphatase A
LWWLEAAVILIVFLVGVWAATRAEEHFGLIDPGPVVIDEVLGMLVTLAFVPVGLTGAIVGFVAFRVCDVIKPPPAKQMERFPGGWGVMSDDFMAGIWALVIVRLLVWIFPAWML